MHVTPIDSRNFSVLPLLTRLFYPNPCPPLVCSLPAQSVRWQCSVCVRQRQRYCIGMVIRTDKARILMLEDSFGAIQFAGFSA
jgi:hypothetical protein